jgi:hypothetical protein
MSKAASTHIASGPNRTSSSVRHVEPFGVECISLSHGREASGANVTLASQQAPHTQTHPNTPKHAQTRASTATAAREHRRRGESVAVYGATSALVLGPVALCGHVLEAIFAEHHECQHRRSRKHAGSTMIHVIDSSCELDRHIRMLI